MDSAYERYRARLLSWFIKAKDTESLTASDVATAVKKSEKWFYNALKGPKVKGGQNISVKDLEAVAEILGHEPWEFFAPDGMLPPAYQTDGQHADDKEHGHLERKIAGSKIAEAVLAHNVREGLSTMTQGDLMTVCTHAFMYLRGDARRRAKAMIDGLFAAEESVEDDTTRESQRKHKP